MAESLSSQPADAPHDADAVARKQFEVTRRGFDQNQVRAYLYSVASTIRAGERREAELRDRVAAAVRRAHDAEKLDENALTERLGEETVRVLTTAREAADAKVAKATEDADELLSAARTEAAEIREQADSILEARSAEAEIAAEAIREEARAELVKAQELGVAEIEAGKVAAAELIAEGQTVREEVLRDMSKRRQQAKAQVERLRAGRDRLMGTFDTVQEALDDVRTGVKNSLGEAKISADMAARRVLDERPPGLEELEAEVETARVLGLASPTAPAKEEAGSADSSADGGKASAEGSDEPGSDEPEEADSSADGEEDSAVGSDETEPRAVELDPEVRAGKKLRDQPEVEGDELLTVVMDDPVEAVEVKTDESAEGSDEPEEADSSADGPEEPADFAEEADSSADGEKDSAEGSDEPAEAGDEPAEGSDQAVDDLFARLRSEQDQTEEDADIEAGDLFDESEPATAESADPEAEAGDSSDSAGLFDETEPDGDESEAADDAEALDDAEVLDEVIAALVSTAERRLKRVLADDQNRVLAGLRPKGKGKRRGDPPDQLDLDTQIDLYLEAVSAQMDARAEQGGANDTAAARAVLADTLVTPLREAVEAAIESNADPDDRVSAVRAIYRERKVGMGEVAAELIG